MKEDRTQRVCSVGRSLEILGDRWVFLILRETFFGVRYYDEFLTNLGIATNVLSQRLAMLVENGILKRRKDEKDARRIRYSLTEKGMGIYSITLTLMAWGDRWLAGEEGPPLLLHHEACGHRLRPVVCCAHCGQEVDPRDISFEEGPGARGSAARRSPARVKAKKMKKKGPAGS